MFTVDYSLKSLESTNLNLGTEDETLNMRLHFQSYTFTYSMSDCK